MWEGFFECLETVTKRECGEQAAEFDVKHQKVNVEHWVREDCPEFRELPESSVRPRVGEEGYHRFYKERLDVWARKCPKLRNTVVAEEMNGATILHCRNFLAFSALVLIIARFW